MKERSYADMESRSDFINSPAIRNLIHGGNWDDHFWDDFDLFANKEEEYWKDVIRETFDGPRVHVSGALHSVPIGACHQ